MSIQLDPQPSPTQPPAVGAAPPAAFWWLVNAGLWGLATLVTVMVTGSVVFLLAGSHSEQFFVKALTGLPLLIVAYGLLYTVLGGLFVFPGWLLLVLVVKTHPGLLAGSRAAAFFLGATCGPPVLYIDLALLNGRTAVGLGSYALAALVGGVSASRWAHWRLQATRSRMVSSNSDGPAGS